MDRISNRILRYAKIVKETGFSSEAERGVWGAQVGISEFPTLTNLRKVMDKVVTLNQRDCYVIGHLVVKEACSKETATSLAKSYIASAEKLVKCGSIQKHMDKYWVKK